VGKEWHDTSFEQCSQHKIKADPQEPVLYGAFIGHKSALCRPSTWVLSAVGNWLVTPLMERDPQTYCPWLWLTDMWAMRVVGLTCQWVKVRGQHITWSHFHHWYTGGARHRPTWAPAPLVQQKNTTALLQARSRSAHLATLQACLVAGAGDHGNRTPVGAFPCPAATGYMICMHIAFSDKNFFYHFV
jgi:hypothetical protein